jgi:signal transduction histidine kinase
MRQFAARCRALAIVACAAVATLASAADRPWRVVLLTASDTSLPAFVTMDRVTRDTLGAPGTHATEIYTESLDSFRFLSGDIDAKFLALLEAKYKERPVDAVIAVAAAALDFAERHRQSLWPDAVIVFHSVWEDALQGRTLSPRTTGILTFLDFAGTVELALRLRPETRQLVVISGVSSEDQRLARIAQAQLARLAGKVSIEFWLARDFDEALARVAALPPTASVLYTSLYRDAKDRVFVPREALARLAAASPVPAYGVFDSFQGSGMAAGIVEDMEARGRHAARLVLDALASPGRSLPRPAGVSSSCVADARALRRFDISEALLPRDCAVRFAEPTAWQRYRWQILLGLAIIASQALLIAALLVQRKRRQRAEADMHAARGDLAHAARLASMGELTASIAHQIKQPLSAILAHADTAELLLEAQDPPIAEVQRIIARIRSDDLRASDVITHLHDLLGKHAMERKVVDVNGVVVDTLQVLEAEARRREVTVDSALAPMLPPIVGDRIHLQQVVLNLVLNAMDALAAMPANARRVRVTTALLAGRVAITVADSGPGIDPKIAASLFASFVTTKAQGLGLGLSIARSIVEAHGGRIDALDPEGGGAQFRVTLPLPKTDTRMEVPPPERPSLVRVSGTP